MTTTLRVFKWLRRYPLLAALQLLCACAGVLMGIVFPKAVGKVLDDALPQMDQGLLGFWVLVALGCYFGRDVLNSLRIMLNNTFEQKVIFDLRSDLYERLQRLPLPWFDGRPTGDIMTTVAEDVTSLERVLIDGIEQGLVALLQVAAVGTMLFLTNGKLAGIAMLPIPLLAAGAFLYTTTSRERHRLVRKASSAMNSLLMDNIGGIRQIKAYTREHAELARFNSASGKLREATLRVMRAWAVYNPAMLFVGALGSVLVLWFGGRAVLAGDMRHGDLVSFLLYLALFYEPIGRLHQLNQILQAGRAAGERVFDILDATEEDEPPAAGREQLAQPVRGHVEFRNVSFAYNERIATLKNVSIEARPGETIALVGPTGAGKSTIINLLCRFYELPDGGGDIVLDGRSIHSVSRSDLRAAIGYVTQESFLFNGTVRDNLRLARESAGEDELWAALDAANAAEFVRRLPERLDTEVGERGVRLSVGEKQRISIARALLKNPPILLLDEATASVDTETERQIQQALDRLMEGRTSFVIAHRLSTVRHAHRIHVLNHGEVVETGTHTELWRKGGLYAELCRHALLIDDTDFASDDAGDRNVDADRISGDGGIELAAPARDELESRLAAEARRRHILEHELKHVRAENDRLRKDGGAERGPPPAGEPPPGSHPELPLRLTPRPLVVYTSRKS